MIDSPIPSPTRALESDQRAATSTDDSYKLTLPDAIEILRRTARAVRADAYTRQSDSYWREILLDQARAMDALAGNHALLVEPVHQIEAALRRAIELALADIDEQEECGIDRAHQSIGYAAIFARVRGELVPRC